MPNLSDLTLKELSAMESSYLEAVMHVTGPTGALIIRKLGEIRAEMEKREAECR